MEFYRGSFYVLFFLSTVKAFSQKTQPNLIYVFADQLRADVLGYAGDKNAMTPNIDRFALESVNFINAVSVCPVSAPHRASLITGKYVSSTGMVINELNMNPNHKTIAHVLKEAGYTLGYIGKVHLNDQHDRSYKKGPERMGFDDYWAAYSFNHESFNSYYYTDDDNGEEIKVDLKGKYGPDVFTQLALNFMENVGKENKPFALFLSWNPPHDPWTRNNVQAQCYEKFKDTIFELPQNFNDLPDKYMDRYPQDFFEGDSLWKRSFIEDGGFQETLRCYYSMVNSIDEEFGKVLSAIDSLDIFNNTIVVFTSDHGEMFTSQGRMYKLTFYDEAARVPFLIRYPALATKGDCDVCLNTPDIAPTLLGLMGLKDYIPKEMEGFDLSFILRKEKGLVPDFAFMQGMGHTYQWKDGFEWRAIRDKRYTYAIYLRDGSELLFDRNNDPYMMRNVVDDLIYKDVLNDLRMKMKAKMEFLNDEFKPCTWYKEHWMYKDYSIKSSARGDFGPLPPIEPFREK